MGRHCDHVAVLVRCARTYAQVDQRKPTPAPEESASKEYAALPSELTPEGEHSGTFGMSKYVYYGRHSEGNRFIRNNDL